MVLIRRSSPNVPIANCRRKVDQYDINILQYFHQTSIYNWYQNIQKLSHNLHHHGTKMSKIVSQNCQIHQNYSLSELVTSTAVKGTRHLSPWPAPVSEVSRLAIVVTQQDSHTAVGGPGVLASDAASYQHISKYTVVDCRSRLSRLQVKLTWQMALQ